jgi:hypothetical protein
VRDLAYRRGMTRLPSAPSTTPSERPSSPSRRGIERDLAELVDRWSIHSVLHALAEVCYAHAAEYEKSADFSHSLHASNWRQVCRAITSLENLVSRLTL